MGSGYPFQLKVSSQEGTGILCELYCVSTLHSSGIDSDYSRLCMFTPNSRVNVADSGIRLVRKFVMIIGPVTLLAV